MRANRMTTGHGDSDMMVSADEVNTAVTAAEAKVNETKFRLVWTGEKYRVSKPNLDTQEVVPLSVVMEILNFFKAE